MFQIQLAAAALNCKSGYPVCATAYGKAQKSMDSGFPLDWFTESVDEKLICEICGKVLQNPRATPCCSNVFCLHCLDFWIDYYGVCPKRCGEIEVAGLLKNPAVEKSIQSLEVHCNYNKRGCKAKMTLVEKQKHEKKCPYRPETTDDMVSLDRKSSSQSHDAYVEMASVACRNKTVSGGEEGKANLHPIFAGGLAYHTYDLTRRAPGESLGFVLVAGAKNSNGKAVNFSIKTVNPQTVAEEVGLLPGDRIVQVDNIPLSQLTQPEAISRIKDNPRVILTVIRSSSATKAFGKSRPSLHDHVYEDILNSEDSSPIDKENTVLLQQESFRDRLGGCSREEMMRRKQRKQSDSQPMRINTSPGGSRHVSSSFLGDSGRGNVKPLTEKVSKDSGLSVGSSMSPSPHQHSGRHSRPSGDQVIRRPEPHLNMMSKHSYRSEREAMKRGSRDEDSCGSTDLPTMDPTKGQIYIDGDYEIEEIYLQKNGTNQLGITLGYDTKSSCGNLLVCEVVPSGLAAQDGRLRKGDIIQQVNGFEVYDPEEAVLLFLEQDQDITLTVARKIKSRRKRFNMLSSKSQSSLDKMFGNDGNFDLRRTDSCGSLDSSSHRQEEAKAVMSPRRHSESAKLVQKISVGSNRTFHPPTVSSSGYATGGETPSVSTDFVFRPIMEVRPATAGDLTRNNRHLRSSTSLGSDPDRSMTVHPHFQPPVSRHRSLEGGEHYRLKSPSAAKGFSYRAPSPLKNSTRSFFSDNPQMTDQVAPMDRMMMHRSISTFRCESLV